MKNIGIIISNTGTPNAPTPKAVRTYLREFLSDKRIVQLPRWLWLPILFCLILPLRPKRSAKLYQHIWTEQGSPMRIIMNDLREKLEKFSEAQELTIKSVRAEDQRSDVSKPKLNVEVGMNYGDPSIKDAINKLTSKNVEKIIVLPLFPQYSNTTTASTFDRTMQALAQLDSIPEISFLTSYATHPAYIKALADSVRNARIAKHLLISFHGIPKRFVDKGDPYAKECEQTATLLADALGLTRDQWTLCYQSQFGYDKWLQPSTQKVLTALAQQGITDVDVVCPGFAVDCLETLEEIALRGKEIFMAAGGKTFNYIPALNATNAHVNALIEFLSKH